MRREHRHAAAALLLYVAVTGAVTLPLLKDFGNQALGNPDRNIFKSLWRNWWYYRAATSAAERVRFTPLVYFPAGLDLRVNMSQEGLAFLSIPPQVFLSPVATHNVLQMLLIALAGWGMFLLLRDLTGLFAPAFLGGVIFSYFPAMLGFIDAGTEPQSGIFLIPIAVLCYRRYLASGRLWPLGGFVLFSTANFVLSAYSGLWASIFAVALGAVHVARERKKSPRRARLAVFQTVVAFMLIGALYAPLVYPVLKEGRDPGGEHRGVAIEPDPRDLSDLFVPFKRSEQGPWCNKRYNTLYLCYTSIAFMVVAALTGFRRVKWLLLALVGLTLPALGSELRFLGATLVPESIYGLPYRALGRVFPMALRIRGVFVTFPTALFFLVAIIAAHGASWLCANVRRGSALVYLGSALFLVESLFLSPSAYPFKVFTDEWREYTDWLRDREERGALIEIPMCLDFPPPREPRLYLNMKYAGYYLYFQTRHERPIVNTGRYGPVWRAGKDRALNENVVLRKLFRMQDLDLFGASQLFPGSDARRASVPDDRGFDQLRTEGCRYVAVHEDLLTPIAFQLISAYLRSYLGEPAATVSRTHVFDLEAGQVPSRARLRTAEEVRAVFGDRYPSLRVLEAMHWQNVYHEIPDPRYYARALWALRSDVMSSRRSPDTVRDIIDALDRDTPGELFFGGEIAQKERYYETLEGCRSMAAEIRAGLRGP